jgi:chromosome segregation ATPase
MVEVFGAKPKIPVSKKELSAAVLKANTSLRVKNKKLENRAKEKESQLKALDNERKSLENEIKSLSSNIDSLKKEIVKNNDKLRIERPKLTTIKNQVLEAISKENSAQSNFDKLGKESDILAKNIEKMNSDLAIVSTLKSEIKLLKADKKSGLKELAGVNRETNGIKAELSKLQADVVNKKEVHEDKMSKLDLEIKDKELSLSKVDGKYVIKMAELNTKLNGLEDYTKEKEQEASVIESLVKQREHAYIDIETKFKQAENALIYAKELTDKEVERERDEKEKIRKKFKQWKIGALEDVARLKLKKKIENIDKAGLMEILNG